VVQQTEQQLTRHHRESEHRQVETMLEDHLQRHDGRLDQQVAQEPEHTEGEQAVPPPKVNGTSHECDDPCQSKERRDRLEETSRRRNVME
jgi:hypothetical protein